jgi:hypothetical protein
MAAPDRLALLASQDAWAAGKAARPPAREDTRDHASEIMASHGDVPSPAAAVASGVTAASGEGHGPWPRPVI